MIIFNNLNQDLPYLRFKKSYDAAFKLNQKNIEAISISSYSQKRKEVNSRFVNLKFINNNEFIFFSNYESPKSQEFSEHNQVTALIYWHKTNTQIRLKALISKTSVDFNNEYFMNRSHNKNALSISSNQSVQIDSYQNVIDNYNECLELDNLMNCPQYWGGFSFTPYYFEFWEGHDFRLNKRDIYEKSGDDWNHSILQP